jgi:hypothetical protein
MALADTLPSVPTATLIPFHLDIDPGASREDEMRRAIAQKGGVVLFHLDIAGDGAGARSATAVAFGACGDEDIAIVTVAADGRTTIEPASASKLPIASIASSFAGLAQCWGAIH